jgi:hypothetical protein
MTTCFSKCSISAIYSTLEEGGIDYLPMQLYPRAMEVISGMRIPIPQPDQTSNSLDEDGVV